ncbi:MAG: hypothetical protein NTV46_01255, partial [Verrucomicrobia bacterium]|nr:hypothetical protein [Verrucomicrobiota bacterium]
TTKASSRKKAEPKNPMREFNDLGHEWERDVVKLERLTRRFRDQGGLSEFDDPRKITEYLELCGVVAAQAKALIGGHEAIITGIKARPDAVGFAAVIDSHKDGIELMRECFKNTRDREKEVRRMFAKIKAMG